MADSAVPSMGSIASFPDQMQQIARIELNSPRAWRENLWGDGDYDIQICHKLGSDEHEQLIYRLETSAVVW